MSRKATKKYIRDMTGLCPVRFLKIPPGISDQGLSDERENCPIFLDALSAH
jgi:hypothetical protein